jgi:hypothetical protein
VISDWPIQLEKEPPAIAGGMIMYRIRQALPGDLPIIVDYRITMFQTFVKDAYDWNGVKAYEEKYFAAKRDYLRNVACV